VYLRPETTPNFYYDNIQHVSLQDTRECSDVARLTRADQKLRDITQRLHQHNDTTFVLPSDKSLLITARNLFDLRISQRWLWTVLGCKATQSVESHPTFWGNITVCYLVRNGILFDLLFYADDGGSMFLRNICWLSPDYMALYPRRQNFPSFISFLHTYSPCGPWPLFQFLNLYTTLRTPWAEDQPVVRPLPTHNTTQRINAHRHPCPEWDSNPWPVCSCGRRRFMS
jgi:hypothetical protein